MSLSTMGMFAGLLVAIAAAAGGFTGFILALLFAVIGVVVGAQLEGRIDVPGIVKSRQR